MALDVLGSSYQVYHVLPHLWATDALKLSSASNCSSAFWPCTRATSASGPLALATRCSKTSSYAIPSYITSRKSYICGLSSIPLTINSQDPAHLFIQPDLLGQRSRTLPISCIVIGYLILPIQKASLEVLTALAVHNVQPDDDKHAAHLAPDPSDISLGQVSLP